MTRLPRVLGLALLLWTLTGVTQPAKAGFFAPVTYYDLQGRMANGEWVHDGAAACPKDYLGWHVRIVAPDVWVDCDDTGAAWAFEAGYFRLDVSAPARPWWMTDAPMELELYQP